MSSLYPKGVTEDMQRMAYTVWPHLYQTANKLLYKFKEWSDIRGQQDVMEKIFVHRNEMGGVTIELPYHGLLCNVISENEFELIIVDRKGGDSKEIYGSEKKCFDGSEKLWTAMCENLASGVVGMVSNDIKK